ncbi:SDR family NAD(P)-dependent oxidoreductase [Sphingosinicellaceae bacterium]|nr:SDR family NAD(P)-dependent oxidoreductase [Sphingosinicellaceae bacterium]
MDIMEKRAIVTGGTSGIGLEIARELVQRGARVGITGRDKKAVDRAVSLLTPDGTVHGISADVTTEEGRQHTLALAVDTLGGLDILINNAGGVRAGRLEAIKEDEILHMIAVNLTAPILLTREALPALRKSGKALIVNVSSEIARIALPFYATYAATKAGIASFSEALRRELAGEGVGVLTVYPSATETPMMATSGLAKGERQSPAVVAKAVIKAIIAGDVEVVRTDDERRKLAVLNRADPAAADAALAEMKDHIEQAAKNHSAL